MPNFTILGVSHSLLFLEMAKIWPFYGQNKVLQICSPWILINVYRYIPRQILHWCMYSVAPIHRNGQNMGILWPTHCPHLVLLIGSCWILIIVPRDVPSQMSHCWLYLVAPFQLTIHLEEILDYFYLNQIRNWWAKNFLLFLFWICP